MGNHVVTKIYLSGPISLDGRATPAQTSTYLGRFATACAKLRNMGFTVMNPCELSKQSSWEAYMRLNIPDVCEAHVIAVLPEWQKSRGSRLEVFLAHELQIPVVKVEDLYAKSES